MTDLSRLIAELHSSTVKKRRNAAVLMGKSGNHLAIGPLIEALADPHPGVRSEIIQALGRLGDSSSVTGLIASLRDADRDVRAAAISSLGKLRTGEPLNR